MKSSTDKMNEIFADKSLTTKQHEEKDFLVSRKTYSASQTLRFVQLVLEVSNQPSARPLAEVS